MTIDLFKLEYKSSSVQYTLLINKTMTRVTSTCDNQG